MCTEHQILCSNSTCCSKYQSRAAGCRGNGTPVQYSEQQLCQSLAFSIFFYFHSFRVSFLLGLFFVCVACVTGKPWAATIRYCSMSQVHSQGLCHWQTSGRGCRFFPPRCRWALSVHDVSPYTMGSRGVCLCQLSTTTILGPTTQQSKFICHSLNIWFNSPCKWSIPRRNQYHIQFYMFIMKQFS